MISRDIDRIEPAEPVSTLICPGGQYMAMIQFCEGEVKITGLTPERMKAMTDVLTKDDEQGITWWNNLTDAERTEWLRRAGTAIAKDAWEAYKRDRDWSRGFSSASQHVS